MAGSLTLTIGTSSVSIPLKLTNAKLRAAVQRYALENFIQVEGRTEQDVARDVLRVMLRELREGSIRRQRSEYVAQQQAAFEATLLEDNDVFDDV